MPGDGYEAWTPQFLLKVRMGRNESVLTTKHIAAMGISVDVNDGLPSL
jgi:hypothetical protein